MPLTMSPAPAIASISSESQRVFDETEDDDRGTPHHDRDQDRAALRRTCPARPENAVARNAPAAGAATRKPQHRGAVSGSTARRPPRGTTQPGTRTPWRSGRPGTPTGSPACPSGTGSRRRSRPSPATGASCAGGDGAMRSTNPIATRNVSASTTNTPAGAITASRTPAATGPSMPHRRPEPGVERVRRRDAARAATAERAMCPAPVG